jgi:8-oxo-dGTP diphosphatase
MAEEKPKWKKETSAGGVVYKEQDGQLFVLLIQPKGSNYGPPAGYWTFPKGLVDHKGEDFKVAALREVKEEGGVEAEIEKELGYIKYFRGASSGYSPAIKFVHYFLMKYVSGDITDHDEEIAEVGWYPKDQVIEKLRFKHDKEIYERAYQLFMDQNEISRI